MKEAGEPVPVANIIHLFYVTHSIEYAMLQMLSADHHQLAIDRHPSSSISAADGRRRRITIISHKVGYILGFPYSWPAS